MEWDPPGRKWCQACRTEKDTASFSVNKKIKDGFFSYCKECVRMKAKEYRTKNPEKARDRARNYQKKNPDKMRELQKTWRAANRKYIRDWARNKYHNDSYFKVKRGIIRTLTQFRKRTDSKKLCKHQELIGCTVKFLHDYLLANRKDPNMTLENCHIDHIKPIAAFGQNLDLVTQKEACHYTNLQLLWPSENRIKSSTYNGVHYKIKK
jgi:hypothetical protein